MDFHKLLNFYLKNYSHIKDKITFKHHLYESYLDYNLKREKLKLGSIRYELRNLYNSKILIYSSFEPVDKGTKLQQPSLLEGVFSINSPHGSTSIHFTRLLIYMFFLWLLVINPT